jgi:hypothetical protein
MIMLSVQHQFSIVVLRNSLSLRERVRVRGNSWINWYFCSLIRPSLLRWSFGAQAGHLLPEGEGTLSE